MTRTVLRQLVTAATGNGALVAVAGAQVAVTRVSDGLHPVVWTDPTAGSTIPSATALTDSDGQFECWLDSGETDLIFNFTVTALPGSRAVGASNRVVSFPTKVEEVDVRSGPPGPTGPGGPGVPAGGSEGQVVIKQGSSTGWAFIHDTVDVSKITGVDPTGATDSTTALLTALVSDSQTIFDFGGAENTYKINPTALNPFIVTRDGLHLRGRKAQINVQYLNDGVVNGIELRGNRLTVEGLVFCNTAPITPWQRVNGGSSSNGDMIRLGGTISGSVYTDVVTVRDCESWGAYNSGFYGLQAARVFVENSHSHACCGNGLGFTDLQDTLMVSHCTVTNNGDDMLAVLTDSGLAQGTPNVMVDHFVGQFGGAKGIGFSGAYNFFADHIEIHDTYSHGLGLLEDTFYSLGSTQKGFVDHIRLQNIGTFFGASGSGANYTGEWQPSHTYSTGDIVSYHGALWQTPAGHTSGSTFGSLLPGQNSHWTEFIGYLHSAVASSVNGVTVSSSAYDLGIGDITFDNVLGRGISIAGANPSQQVTGSTTLGANSGSTTSVALAALVTNMPTSSDHASIYDPVTNQRTVFTYSGISGSTLTGCYANSPGAQLSFGATSYVNIPASRIRIKAISARRTTSSAMQVAAGASTLPGSLPDYLQAADVEVGSIDVKECVGGLVVGSCTDVTVHDWNIRSYLASGSGSRRGIQYSNVRNLRLGGGLILNDDGGDVEILSTGTNINVTGPAIGYKGAWAASTRYLPGDMVTQNGALYLAGSSFTSGSTFTATNWKALTGGASIPQRTATGLWLGATGVALGSNALVTNNRLYYVPVAFTFPVTAVTLRVNITVAGSSGAVFRYGIYNDDGTTYPGTKLLDAGTVAATGTGTTDITISQALTPGIYWLAICGQGSPTTPPTVSMLSGQLPGLPRPSSGSANYNGVYQDSITGALPSSVGAASFISPTPNIMLGT